MKAFMDEDFLLSCDMARTLFHQTAEHAPIIDYHCHVSPKEIWEDRHFDTMTQVWLGGDHYKWRLMRAAGVPEYYITGGANDREKFQHWAETLQTAVGNPLYHWSHLELQRYFDYHGTLRGDTAEEVWNLCNARLHTPEMSVRQLIVRSGVTLLCTTDDPTDSLAYHEKLAADPTFPVTVLPAFRPDKALNIEQEGFADYLLRLGACSGVHITSFDTLKEALRRRMAFFASHGCRLSDHALSYVLYYPTDDREIDGILHKRLSGSPVTSAEEKQYKTAFMIFLGREYKRLDWAMQLHYGCRRNNNTRMFRQLGPDTGYDCIDNYAPTAQMAAFLDALDRTGDLPRTLIYSLNPVDDAAIESVIGCFQNSDAIGKLQHGSAWWFNDHLAGMRHQLTTLASQGRLAGFVGMLTDSRSFLSYPRHEYFRRILCDLLGRMVEDGLYPADAATLSHIVRAICYDNADRYFRFPRK